MHKWTDIRRRILVFGETKRSVQRLYGIHWQTLNKILSHADMPGYRMAKKRPRVKLAPFIDVIRSWLEADKAFNKKQRHTGKRVFDRLRKEHGYTGGYTVIKDFLRDLKLKQQEVFMPLSHRPGEAQVDFGHAEVVVDGKTIKAALFVMTLPYSDAFLVQAYPRETTEAFQDGHLRAFEFFGGVPRRITYDNSVIAVAKVGKGRERQHTREFSRLLSHFLFSDHFCRVRRANEKGHVERLVGFARRNFLVPVPEVASLAELNEKLLAACQEDLARILRGKPEGKQARLEAERPAFLEMPAQEFEARRIVPARANTLSLVRFDNNDYSVPTEFAHQALTLIASVDHVKIACGPRLAAIHKRIWEKEQVCFDPVHYLALLERKPGAIDYARPLEDWPLPETLQLLRRRLEGQFDHKGTREFVKVLRLLERHGMTDLVSAVEKALEIGALSFDGVRVILEGLKEAPAKLFCLEGRLHLSQVYVASPNLAAYASLQEPVLSHACPECIEGPNGGQA
jgi:transposase